MSSINLVQQVSAVGSDSMTVDITLRTALTCAVLCGPVQIGFALTAAAM